MNNKSFKIDQNHLGMFSLKKKKKVVQIKRSFLFTFVITFQEIEEFILVSEQLRDDFVFLEKGNSLFAGLVGLGVEKKEEKSQEDAR